MRGGEGRGGIGVRRGGMEKRYGSTGGRIDTFM